MAFLPFSAVSSNNIQQTVTQTAHGFTAGQWVYLSAASTYALADADAVLSADSVGVVTSAPTANTFVLNVSGYVTGLTGLTPATRYYISGTAGTLTNVAPANSKAVFISDTTTSGWVQQYQVTTAPITVTDWATATAYKVGDARTAEGRLYRALTAHTSTTFAADRANWVVVSPLKAVVSWAAATYYYAGDVVSVGTRTLVKISSGLSGATFDNTEAALWTLQNNDAIVPWAATTYFYAGEQVVTPAGTVIRKIASGLSGATFDNTEAALWDVTVPSARATFIPSAYYFAKDLTFDTLTGTTYVRSVGGVAGTSLDTAELTNWLLFAGSPFTTIAAATPYTVVETDHLINLPGGATFTITIPAGRVNSVIKFSTDSLSATPPTIATSGGETIIDPTTFTSVTSFVMPSVVALASTVTFQKVGTSWRFVA